jgi:exonuclease III
MIGLNVFIWNVRGLNMRARRSAVREFLNQERVAALCLVETKISVLSDTMAYELMGTGFDYVCLPSVGASGGIVVAWARSEWTVTARTCRTHSVTITVSSAASPSCTWSLSCVYGPVLEELKPGFLDELRDVHAQNTGPLLFCGDFNQIYRAADKNNSRLNLQSMRRFRRLLNDLQLQELYLHGRLYTWSNARHRPTLERIDRAFASVDWLEAFPSHHLRCLSSDSNPGWRAHGWCC